MARVPLYVERAAVSRLWDVDGNEYVDYVLGQGPALLGHCPPAVVKAVTAQVSRGILFSAQHALEVRVAERLCAMVSLGRAGPLQHRRLRGRARRTAPGPGTHRPAHDPQVRGPLPRLARPVLYSATRSVTPGPGRSPHPGARHARSAPRGRPDHRAMKRPGRAVGTDGPSHRPHRRRSMRTRNWSKDPAPSSTPTSPKPPPSETTATWRNRPRHDERPHAALLDRGVNIAPRGLWFLSTTHTATDIEFTINVFGDALTSLPPD